MSLIIMPGNLVCDFCNKQIGDYSNTHFSDREKDLDFCSETCHLAWEDFATQFKSFRLPGDRLDRHWNDKNLNEVINSYRNKNIDGKTAGLVYNLGVEPNEITSQGTTEYDGKTYNLRDENGVRTEELDQDQLTTENWERWLDISRDFTENLVREWVDNRFPYEITSDWINIGLEPTDVYFAKWLRDIKK